MNPAPDRSVKIDVIDLDTAVSRDDHTAAALRPHPGPRDCIEKHSSERNFQIPAGAAFVSLSPTDSQLVTPQGMPKKHLATEVTLGEQRTSCEPQAVQRSGLFAPSSEAARLVLSYEDAAGHGAVTVEEGAVVEVQGPAAAAAIASGSGEYAAGSVENGFGFRENDPFSREIGGTSGRRRRRSTSGRGFLVSPASAAGAGGEENVSQEEADLRLARAVQEQECAFMFLQQQQRQLRPQSAVLASAGQLLALGEELGSPGDDGHVSVAAEEQAAGAEAERNPTLSLLPDDMESGDSDVAILEGHHVDGGGGGLRDLDQNTEEVGKWGEEGENEDGDEPEVTDEELARQLQEEEEQAMAERLLAMAGMGVRMAGGRQRPVMADFMVGPPGMVTHMHMEPWAFGEQSRETVDGAYEEAAEGDYDSQEGYDEDEELDEDELEYAGAMLDVDNMTYEELTALGEAIGTEAKGLPEQTIAALPRCTYLVAEREGSRSPGKSEDDEICAICRCEFEDAEKLILLSSCNHSYHESCISQWLQMNKVCPICKTEVWADSGSKQHKTRGKHAKSHGL